MKMRRTDSRGPDRHRPNRRGAVLPLVCLLLVALLGVGALAIDLGRLYYTGAEVQAAADAAALAATRAKQYNPIDWPTGAIANAQAAARDVAGRNRAAGAPVQVSAPDVVPMAYDPTTRPVPTPTSWTSETAAIQVTATARPSYVLASTLGLAAPVVRRTATAWLANVNGANCVRPLSIKYTRFYEEGVTHDTRYTASGTFAPQFNLWDIASTQYANLAERTFIILPPDARESDWEARGFNAHGNWRPMDFAGGGLPAFTTRLGAPEGSPGCADAQAAIGDVKAPLLGNASAIVTAASAGMAQLCNRMGNADNAFCYDSRGAVGVKTRIVLSDSVGSGTSYTLRVQEVGVARVMCYFRSERDVCNNVPMNEPAARGTWSYFGPRVGYPAGTIILFLDTPGSTAITPDVVLGTKPGLTQRLLLVK